MQNTNQNQKQITFIDDLKKNLKTGQTIFQTPDTIIDALAKGTFININLAINSKNSFKLEVAESKKEEGTILIKGSNPIGILYFLKIESGQEFGIAQRYELHHSMIPDLRPVIIKKEITQETVSTVTA